MANVKISDLPAATAAASGNELEINEAGTSKKLTVEQVAAYVESNFDTSNANGISAFGATLIDDADAATARTTLGLVIGTNVQAYDADTMKTDVAQTMTAAFTFKEITETTYAISDGASVSLDPANGSTQTWTLGANRVAASEALADGQWIELFINDGSGYTLNLDTNVVSTGS